MNNIPNDLISTQQAATLVNVKSTQAIRYHISTKALRGFKNRRGYYFVSKAEVLQLFYSDEIREV